MGNTILIKGSNTSSEVPSSLTQGTDDGNDDAATEIAINRADGKIYYLNDSDSVTEFTSSISGNTYGGSSFKIGRDADNLLDFSTDNAVTFRVNGANEMKLAANVFSPSTSNGIALGSGSLMWSDLFLASGSVINFNNGDVTATHSSNTLTIAGGNLAIPGFTLDSNTITGIDDSDEFTDDDAHIMTSAAINDRFSTSDTTYSAGTGLSLSSTTFSVDASQTQITSVGTIGTGTWQGTAIASSYIAADAITGAKIADDAIDSEHYTDGSIDTAHLAADAVTGAKIADDAIDSEHYTDGSIDTAHLAADAVTGAKIADDAINSEHYTDGSIDLAHMSSESVDEDNLYISNSGSNGQFLQKQTGNNGGLTWATHTDNDTTYAAGTGITISGGGNTIALDGNSVDEATLKVSNSPTNGYALTAQSGNTGGLTWADLSSGGTPTMITVADESSDTSCNICFFTSATGDLEPKTGSNLTFNSDTGILTASGFRGDIVGDVTGSLIIGGHTMADVDIGSEFVDTDDHLMSSGAIKEKIEDYGYTTNTGDITGVTAGVGLSGGGTSGGVTLTLDLSELSAVTPASGDSLATLDSNGSTEQLTTVDALATLFAGSNLTASSGVIAVDDSFLKNDANDTTSGTITAGGFTTSGSITLGGHAVNDINVASEFTDDDNHLMTAAAINDRFSTSDTTYSAGTGLDLSSTTFSVDVSDFMTNGANNYIVTATGADGMNAEVGLRSTGSNIYIANESAASADIVDYGQLWCKDNGSGADNTELWFTNDAGTDIQITDGGSLAGGGGGGSGVNIGGSSDPQDNQVGVWTSSSAMEGTADLTYASRKLTIGSSGNSGDLSVYEGSNERAGADGTISVPAAMVANLMSGDVMVLGTTDINVYSGIVYNIP